MYAPGWVVEYAHRDSALVADGAVFDTPLGEVETQGTPLYSGTKETMIQAIAEHIPEDQEDGDRDWWRWHMGRPLGC